MRILPLVLIAVGVFGVLKHYGVIDPTWVPLLWPLLFIAVGAVMLARGPHWRAEMRERMQDRWERRMHRRFGPGWASLSEEERERFRAGMRQSHFHGGGCGHSSASTSAPAPASDGSSAKSPVQPPMSGEQR